MDRCLQCQMVFVNGVRCHEHRCPDAWKDYDVECKQCGCGFRPSYRYQVRCDGCVADEMAELSYDDLRAASDFYERAMDEE